MFNAVGNQKSR